MIALFILVLVGLVQLNIRLNKIMSTQAELVTQIKAVNDQLVKIGQESTKTLQKVTELEAVIAAGGDASPELTRAVADLRTQAEALDQLTPDA